MDFVTNLPISSNWKGDSYNSILVIIDQLIKIVHYKLVKVMIDAPGLAEVIINVIVHHHRVSEFIIMDWDLVFILKFWSLLCYFLGIKIKLFTTFHPQMDGQTKRRNSIMDTYLRVFINWEQDDLAKLLPMAKFVYNNTKNTSTAHISFELNCSCHSKVFLKKDIDLHSRSCSANKLVEELRELIEVCYQNLLHVQEL